MFMTVTAVLFPAQVKARCMCFFFFSCSTKVFRLITFEVRSELLVSRWDNTRHLHVATTSETPQTGAAASESLFLSRCFSREAEVPRWQTSGWRAVSRNATLCHHLSWEFSTLHVSTVNLFKRDAQCDRMLACFRWHVSVSDQETWF